MDTYDENLPKQRHVDAEDPTVDAARRAIATLLGPVLIGGVFLVAAQHNTNEEILIIVTNAALIVVAVSHSIRRRTIWQKAALTGALMGAGTTLIGALARTAQEFSVVNIFKVFTEPVITGVIDALVAGMVFLLATLLLTKRRAYGNTKKENNNKQQQYRSSEEEG